MGEENLRTIDWQNQELDRQTRAITEVGSQTDENVLRIDKSLMMSNEALMISNEAIERAPDKPAVIIDYDASEIFFNDTKIKPSNKIKLKKSLGQWLFEINGVKITYQYKTFIVNDNIYKFPYGFINFLTNSDVLFDDDIEENETIIKKFLFDIGHDIRKGDKKSSRYRTIKLILVLKDDVFGKGLNSTDINPSNQRSCLVNDLIEILELLILETKAGHDGLYDEMLDITKSIIYEY